MAETRRKFDRDFKDGAVRLVRETGRPIAEVARDLGVNEGTLGNWVNADRRRRGDGNAALSEDERAELARLRKENAELAMAPVLKRSVALWLSGATQGPPAWQGRTRIRLPVAWLAAEAHLRTALLRRRSSYSRCPRALLCRAACRPANCSRLNHLPQ